MTLLFLGVFSLEVFLGVFYLLYLSTLGDFYFKFDFEKGEEI
jgi:hypothetical protein